MLNTEIFFEVPRKSLGRIYNFTGTLCIQESKRLQQLLNVINHLDSWIHNVPVKLYIRPSDFRGTSKNISVFNISSMNKLRNYTYFCKVFTKLNMRYDDYLHAYITIQICGITHIKLMYTLYYYPGFFDSMCILIEGCLSKIMRLIEKKMTKLLCYRWSQTISFDQNLAHYIIQFL
jgi:hypothetical protein